MTTVDLTEAVDDSLQSPTGVAMIDLTSNQHEHEEEDESPAVLLGSLSCNIVGIRYYSGVAHPGEFVTLVREPSNPYDRNAIRVDNMAGVKVGHIKKTTASALAPIMDSNMDVKIDGTIPSPGNAYTLPCSVEIYGGNEALFEQVHRVLTQHRQSWRPSSSFVRSKKSKTTVEVSKKSIDWRSAQQNLDELFDKMSQAQLKNLPGLDPPKEILTPLLAHQLDGLRWLYKRETITQAAPFYKQLQEGGQKVWLSEITNSSQTQEPTKCKGSILADDMGLGKTMQAIALILANPSKSSNKTTLIVSPVSVMQNWIQQIEQHVTGDHLKVALYHGPERYNLLNDDSIDVLISSYGTISTDHGVEFPKKSGNENSQPKKKKARKNQRGASIFAKNFHRVILDEAHTIRNTKARASAGCKALKSEFRLCLTGTPLQNKPEDIQSLFSFLGVEPLSDGNIFRRAISQPIQNGDSVGLSRLRTMMAHVALRRNKSKLDLVEKTVEIRSVVFPPESMHKKVHDALFKSAQVAFRATLSGGDAKALSNYFLILETLTRIRQSCCSGSLVPSERLKAAEAILKEVEGKGQLSHEEGEELLKKLKGKFEDTEAVECAICLNEMEESAAVILRSCSHVFCEPCLSKVSEQCRGLCPFCRGKFEPQDMIKKSVAVAAASTEGATLKSLSESLDDLGNSPKIEALGQAIGEMKNDEKGVIFSQFTKFLDTLEPFLTSMGFTFVRIDGSKSAKQRIAAMKEFNAESGPRIMLASLHAAGTGITLNRANHCYLMDTWWSSSVENQAMDRVHRIGQTRTVRVLRFVMKDTIEERMIALQEAKAAIGKGAMQKLKPEEMRKARIGDLKSLFSIQL